MISRFPLRNAVCIAALFTAPAAFADVTAEQVWENWKSNLDVYGDNGISIGAETVDGGTVTVSDLVLTVEDAESKISTTIETIVFEEQSDGTVDVTMPETYIIDIDLPSEQAGFDLAVTQENMVITAGGTEDLVTYDVVADSYEIRVAEFKDEAAEMAGDALFKAYDLVGSYSANTGEGLAMSYDFEAGGFDLLFDVKEPAGDDHFVFSGKLDGLSTSGEINLPEGFDEEDANFSGESFVVNANGDMTGAGFIFDVNIDGDQGTGSLEVGAAGFDMGVNQDALSYGVSFADMNVAAQSPDLPLPVVVGMSLFENKIKIPVSATDDAAPFEYRFEMANLTINDEVWAMGDPSGAFPRDPLSVVIDLSGTAKLFFDLFDPEQQAAMAFADVPGELTSLSINAFGASGVGVDVTTSGDFTFDNTDLETFDGFPRPAGELNVGITGANALIDTLIEMGLLPQDQATMGRMMMGMFTQPAGDDALTSKIEINEQGHVLANGQRIQ